MGRQAVLCFLLPLIFELSQCTRIQTIHGSTLVLPCVHPESDSNGMEVSWKFQGEVIRPALKPGPASFAKQGHLVISPVTYSSAGEYECFTNGTNMEIIGKYSITVMGYFEFSVNVIKGSNVLIPCYYPTFGQRGANALWFKEDGSGNRIKLDTEDESAEDKRVELLYLGDPDQTIMLRKAVMEDAGLYTCESPDGEKFTTANLSVQAAPTTPPLICEGFDEECQDENSRTAEALLQESLTEFSMNVFSHLRQLEPSNNLLFSPISISGLLSHLLLGASDDTRRALQRAIFVPHDFHCIHSQMKKLREKTSQSLQMASQIYYNPQMNLSESFTERSIQHYEANPVKLLETPEENALMINSWVANKTKNRITHLVNSVPPSTELIMLSAVSFDGQWKNKFNLKRQKEFFTKLDGDLVKVSVLYHPKYKAAARTIAGLNAQVVKLPLSGDNSLYILLPRSNKLAALKQVEASMTDSSVRTMIQQMKEASPEQMEITLPLIKLDVESNINVLMKKLGLSSLFEGANLCGLFPEGKVVLDSAKHKAFLALTEHGVQAGAVTSVSFSRTFPVFSALRPFILMLWNDLADVPLFIGRVTEP
ncbi:Plasma protease C1 inhibitor [Oryzias melastigma]|uniref:Plasma protease C1 inhibitor n=1 Tax=Oryzias melastigma TaxID=30732 RepID=A0A3B3DEE5_ORYME|nr:plasma protease C1 inhibitor [Oryzias melastigma]KAF6733508.1 Plasma protease C1 inhibitor [Oryzias melastigma]